MISTKEKAKKEIERRISIAWKKFWSLKHILKGKYTNKIKSIIFNTCVIPTMLYGAQTWSILKEENKIRITQNKMERSILNMKLMDKIPIMKIRKQLKGNMNVVHRYRRMKWDWAGHVARMSDNRWTYKINYWRPHGKRKRGGQKRNWEDDINNFLQHKLYHRVAWDRSEWNRLREAFAQKQGMERV